MFDGKLIKYALATLMAAAGVLSFSAYAEGFAVAGPADSAVPAPEETTVPAPYTPPRYFNPTPPRRDNPTNPPGTWEVYPSPTTRDLYCVDFVDANNGWAGGRSVALRYRNGTWSVIPGHLGHVFDDIDMLSLNDGWAVGWDGNKELLAIWRWNGSDWKEFQNPTGAVYCIDMIDRSHGWIGGKNYFLRYNGTTWQWGGSAPEIVYDIQMYSDTNGWAVGYRFILRRSGNYWTPESGTSDWYLGSIEMTSTTEGWGTGRKISIDKGLIIRYNGTNWQEHTVVNKVSGLGQLSFVGKAWGWTTGSKGIILFYGGSQWEEVLSPTTNSLGATYFYDKGLGWAMGVSGTILKFKTNVGIVPISIGVMKAIYR